MDSNKRQNTQAFSAFFRSFANSCYIAFCIVAIVTSLQIEMNQLAASARQGVIRMGRGVGIMTNNVAKHQS